MAVEKPKADPGLICHRHGKDVSETCHMCPLYLATEESWIDAEKRVHVNKFFQCADITTTQAFAHLAIQIRAMAAETEAARNEVAEAVQTIATLADRDHKIATAAVMSKIAEAGATIVHARMSEKLIGNR